LADKTFLGRLFQSLIVTGEQIVCMTVLTLIGIKEALNTITPRVL